MHVLRDLREIEMKKQQQQQWRLLFKVFSQTLINSSSSSSSSPSYNIARPFCSLATTTNKQQQQQRLEKKLPLLIVPIVQKKNMFIVQYNLIGSDGSFNTKETKIASTVCGDTLGFISLFHGNDDELNNNNNKDEEVHKLYLPEIADRRICGSSEGWLVTVHENGEIQLLNPFSKVLVHLPPLTAFPGVVAKFITEEVVGDELVPKHKRGRLCYLVDEDGYKPYLSSSRPYHFSSFTTHDSHRFREFFLEKVVTNTTTTTTIDANSTTTSSVVVPTVVMAIYGCHRKLAFCRPTGNGIDDEKNNKWISPLEEYSCGWQEVTFYKGNFYAVCQYGCVNVVKGLDGPSPFLETIIKKYDFEHYTYINYLVESSSSSSGGGDGDGDLLLVTRDIEMNDDYEEEKEKGRPYRSSVFSVLKLDFNRHGPSLVKVTNLGEDCALFIGHNHSFSFSASKFPGCKGNCIYFTDNPEMVYKFPTGGHDIGVYNLEDGSIEKLNYETSSSQLFMPPPIWYVPN